MDKQIEDLRYLISQVDTQIIELIAKRQQIARQIGEYKKLNNLPVLDEKREVLLHEFHDKICQQYDISHALVSEVFKVLIEASRKVQNNE